MDESNFPLEEFEFAEASPEILQESTEEAESSKRPKFALLQNKKFQSRMISVLSLALPFLIASIAYVVSMLDTEGTNMLLCSDGWHQYYPFLVTLRKKLLSGGSMEYSWVVGMGGSFPSLFAYYLASPLYLFSVLVPLDALPHYFTFMTVLKLSLAGCFFTWFLRLVYRRDDISQVFFGLLYAFCAWAAGYYWNIMWLDTFALLPLLIAGTVCLLRDGKFRLYIIALALSLWCNYYVAFFCCIFVLLCFCGYCICCWNGFANLLRRFLRIGLCTLLGVGIACVLLIPTLLAMQTTYSSTSKEFALLQLNIIDGAYGTVRDYGNLWQMFLQETIPGILSASKEVLTGLMPGATPTSLDGDLPNVFCGFSTLMLSLYFFCCKKVSLREKLVSLSLLGFIMVSFIVRWLDYVWHGLHFTNMLPFRFSFLFSFVLIAMAYRAYTLLDDFKPLHLILIAPISALLIYNAWGTENFGAIQKPLSLAIFGAMIVFFLAHYFSPRIKKPQRSFAVFLWKWRKLIVCTFLICILAAEAVLSLVCGINLNGFTSQYEADGSVTYPRENENVQALLGYLDSKTDDPLFYRTEVTSTQTLNDAALNGYNGVSIFNSSANANFNRLTRSLGLASWVGSNRFVYYESSPFTNTMCGIKYLIDRTGNHFNTDYNSLIARSDEVTLLENNTFISVGFMTNSELAEFVVEENRYNPIREQEEMFRMATGIEDELYTHISATDFEKPFSASIRMTGTSGTQYTYSVPGKCSVSLIYTLEEDGLYVATAKKPTGAERKIKVYCNNKYLFTIDVNVRMIFSVGSFKKGDSLEFVYTFESATDGNLSLDLAKQNNNVFDAGLEALSDEPFILREFSDGYVRGTVDALNDGLFYTSIPYEPGWTAYVDGKEVELASGYNVEDKEIILSDAVICFPLSAGSHEIELVYTAPGGKLGLFISIGSLFIFIALWYFLRKKPTLFADKPWHESKKKDLYLSIAALPFLYLTGDLLAVMIKGATEGYQAFLAKNPPYLFAKLISLLKDRRDDEIFVLLSVLAIIMIPFAVYMFSRPLRLAYTLLKQARKKRTVRQDKLEETLEAFAKEEDFFGQEESAQSDQATEESAE